MKKVFYRCNSDLFMKCGDQAFTSGREYHDHYEDDDGISIRDDEGFMHHLGDWDVHFTRIEREVFEAQGFEWFKHVPGDPMPCDGDAVVELLFRGGSISAAFPASVWSWDAAYEEKGWRYADSDPVKAELVFVAIDPSEIDTMQQRDLAAMEDDSLSPAQRKHWDAMEEKQAAKERLQRDAESKALKDRAESLRDAGRAMDRVKLDHTHKLGWRQ